MYNLKEKNAASINNPDVGEKTLFLDIADNKLKTKDEDGIIEEISYINTNAPKVYKALLTQLGTDAPVATVLENTLGGTVVWTYDSPGVYIGTLTGAFGPNPLYLLGTNSDANNDSGLVPYIFADVSTDNISLYSIVKSTGIYSNGLLFNTSILIEVYP